MCGREAYYGGCGASLLPLVQEQNHAVLDAVRCVCDGIALGHVTGRLGCRRGDVRKPADVQWEIIFTTHSRGERRDPLKIPLLPHSV